MMLCKKCGAKLDHDAEFCQVCGEPVEKEVEELFDSNGEPAPIAAEKPQTNKDKQSQLEEIQARRNLKHRKERRNRILLAVLIILLIGGVSGYGIYYYNQNYSDNGIVIETPKPSAIASVLPSAEPTAEPSAEPSAEPTEVPEASAQPSQTPVPGSDVNHSAQNESTATARAWRTSAPVKVTAKPSVSRPAATAKPSASPVIQSVTMGSVMTNQTVRGKEIAVDESTGRRLFVFTIGNVSYLANVDAGSTTNMVKNQVYVIDAKPSGEIYAGLPVYTIIHISKYADYLLPESDKRLITVAELQKLTDKELTLARNEIYARHGRVFRNADIQRYFEAKPWYRPNSRYNYSNDSSNLSVIEKKNIITITNYENSR